MSSPAFNQEPIYGNKESFEEYKKNPNEMVEWDADGSKMNKFKKDLKELYRGRETILDYVCRDVLNIDK